MVEGLSGGNLDDVLRGDDGDENGMAGHELDAAGIARIQGLAGLLPAGTTSFTGGNILLGGEGDDTIEGRGGNDVIDGDVWLNVRLRAPDTTTPAAGDFRLVDSMKSLQTDVFAGRIDPGDISILRNVEPSGAGSFVDTAVFSGPQADYDVTRNADGTTTVAHVRGTAADGTDTLRNIEVLRFTDGIGETAPGAPLAVAATGGNARATVTWTAPVDDGGSAITSYQVEVLAGTTVVRTVTGIAANATSTVVTGLTNGTAYTFRVRAVNAVGLGALSAASNAVTPTAGTVPAAPVIGTASGGAASATVRWTPGATGGSAITSYQVEVRRGTTVVRTVTGIAANATSTVVTGLTNGTAYTFRVRAVNAVGAGAYSAASNAVTPAAATVPGAPVIGTATAGNTTATVRWTPGATGGSAITSYQVEIRRGSSAWRTVTGIAANATSTVVTGLANGTAYTFRVRAVNAVGAGAWSAASAAVKPATVPGAPTFVTATSGAAGGALTASVKWAGPASNGGSAVNGWVVRALRMSSTGAVLATTTSAKLSSGTRSLTMTLPAGNYRFTVQAVNVIGAGPESARSNQVAAR
jgi:hypothetical protein